MTKWFLPVPGRWVAFFQDPETGERPEGFYISEKRAETFHKEPGFLPCVLLKVYSEAPPPMPINEDR